MLGFISQQMDVLSVPYEFGEWASAVTYPYFVGELPSPEAIDTEDGGEETTLFLIGFSRNSFMELESAKERIKKHFDPIHGARGRTADGSGIAVFYSGAFFVPTGEAGLKKIQIELTIKKWRCV